MDIRGKVLKVLPKKQISDKFALREFVIVTDDSKYPQQIILQTSQERCELLNGISEGDDVQAFINIRGRSWTSPQGEERFFNTLEAWKVTVESSQTFDGPSGSLSGGVSGSIESNFKENLIDTLAKDDLPF